LAKNDVSRRVNRISELISTAFLEQQMWRL
jgi:hypothetical protein